MAIKNYIQLSTYQVSEQCSNQNQFDDKVRNTNQLQDEYRVLNEENLALI